MPLTADETLKKLLDATTEAREATRHLHEEVQQANQVIKNQRKGITDSIIAEVDSQVRELSDEARADMKAAIAAVIARIEADWRAKLGLE